MAKELRKAPGMPWRPGAITLYFTRLRGSSGS